MISSTYLCRRHLSCFLCRKMIFFLLFFAGVIFPFATAGLSASEYELEFLSIKPEYLIYFGERKSLQCQVYFLPLGDKVLMVSLGDTPYLGKSRTAQHKMYQNARIRAQLQVERYFSVTVSAEEKSSYRKGKEVFSSRIVSQFTRELKMWQVIGKGVFPYRKTYCCMIGRVFPAKYFPKSLLH